VNSPRPPKLRVRNRQRTIPFDLGWIQQITAAALPHCARAARKDSPFHSLDLIEATVISSRQIAQIHDEFFDDPTPTDVITFDHGEILIGAGIVATQAADYGLSPSQEAALCVIHGMLHLGGWNDLTTSDARAMTKKQESILRASISRDLQAVSKDERTPSRFRPMATLQGLRNLGPKSAAWLAEIGITTRTELAKIGAIEACRRLRTAGYPVSRTMAYAIEGALMDLDWRDIPHEFRLKISLEFKKLRS
jgi:probable rRNA maturation factor